ncbi:MAG: hypothetical protein WC551_04185 [Patescibacteria group bacterium]
MQEELDELKRHIDAFISITPELDAITRKLKAAGLEDAFDGPTADGPIFVFGVKLNPTYEEEGKSFRVEIRRPDVCQNADLAERLRVFKRRIESFEALAEGLKKRGIDYKSQDVDRDFSQCDVTCLAKNPKFTIELKLDIGDTASIFLTVKTPKDDEFFLDIEENSWEIVCDGLEAESPLIPLCESLNAFDAASAEGQAQILDAIASFYLAAESPKAPDRKKRRPKK